MKKIAKILISVDAIAVIVCLIFLAYNYFVLPDTDLVFRFINGDRYKLLYEGVNSIIAYVFIALAVKEEEKNRRKQYWLCIVLFLLLAILVTSANQIMKGASYRIDHMPTTTPAIILRQY